MKEETKSRFKAFCSNTGRAAKFLGGLAWSLAEGYFTHDPLSAYDETPEQKAKREEEECKRREEYEKFLASLTPNERTLYNELQDIKEENMELRDEMAQMSRDKEELQSRIRNLEPES